MTEKGSGEKFAFDTVDADAVCVQCGSVNPEGTVLCKECGNNLREQRQRRIRGEQSPAEEGRGGLRLFTGLLTGLGILIVVAATLNISSIEEWLVSVQESDLEVAGGEDVWGGEIGPMLDGMRVELTDSPSPRDKRLAAIDHIVAEDLFHGRYVLFRKGALNGIDVLGEANLQRRDDKIYFVALLDGDVEVRGVAEMARAEEGDAAEPMPTVWRSGSVRVDGATHGVYGRAEGHESGAHLVVGTSLNDEEAQYFCFATRIR